MWTLTNFIENSTRCTVTQEKTIHFIGCATDCNEFYKLLSKSGRFHGIVVNSVDMNRNNECRGKIVNFMTYTTDFLEITINSIETA